MVSWCKSENSFDTLTSLPAHHHFHVAYSEFWLLQVDDCIAFFKLLQELNPQSIFVYISDTHFIESWKKYFDLNISCCNTDSWESYKSKYCTFFIFFSKLEPATYIQVCSVVRVLLFPFTSVVCVFLLCLKTTFYRQRNIPLKSVRSWATNYWKCSQIEGEAKTLEKSDTIARGQFKLGQDAMVPRRSFLVAVLWKRKFPTLLR